MIRGWKGMKGMFVESSHAAAAALQAAVDEQAREITAAEKALATGRRAHTKHAACLATAEERCRVAAAKFELQ